MRNHWQTLLDKLGYKEGETIVDVGGAMDPVPISTAVVDCVNLGRGGGEYAIIDLCTHRFPYPDNHFDICICSQTLEDLACPHLALLEMSRVAKRGVIEVPHRGVESVRNNHYNSDRREYSMDEIWHFGTGHHKWLIEDLPEGGLLFVPKVHYMLMKHPIPQWNGPNGCQYFWEDNINFGLLYDIDPNAIDEDFARFREQNEEHWK